jgi:hypothetical protein
MFNPSAIPSITENAPLTLTDGMPYEATKIIIDHGSEAMESVTCPNQINKFAHKLD